MEKFNEYILETMEKSSNSGICLIFNGELLSTDIENDETTNNNSISPIFDEEHS